MKRINKIAPQIKAIRLSLKLSQRALGEKIGRNRDVIKDYEHFRTQPRAEDWEAIKALAEQAKKGAA